ncbi:non-ribosomal peptide synthetase [Williamsia sp. 1138]|uniref:non-ribosomal peptide synthetase n=1 Tax=Williamsia sp. 1138 TaxID=1903117 RepID=UPI000A10B28F|nr:non-ribosomal peptide synthetase [Williamsia sp. 1138]OZG26277.1 non-ribosomal peptide synthetase [Williamsia sp. 1138]
MTGGVVDRSAPPAIEDVLALSPLQEGLFSLSKIAGDDLDLYSMQFIVEINGPVDVALLRRSVEAIFERHPNLRVSFYDRDIPTPVQIVPSWVDVPWSERDADPAEFDAIAESERRRNFDLSSGPALRVVLVKFTGGRRRLLITAHHILMDGWAVAIFFQELLAVYEAGGESTSLPAPRPYRDYIGWLAAQDSVAATEAWATYLRRLSAPLMLAEGAVTPADAVPRRTRVQLDPDDTARLTTWARTNGITINTAVQFAWAVVLGRLTDRRDVVFGTTISGRPDSLPGAETMIGLFINTVPSVVDIDPAGTVLGLCRGLQRESATMRELGFLSLSAVQRAGGRGSLFDTLFVFENAPIGAVTEPISTGDGARFLPVAMESLAHYPLTIAAYLLGEHLVVMTEAIDGALPHLPPDEIAERILLVLRQLPDAANSGPDHLEVRLADEVIADEPPASATDAVPSGTIADIFARQVAATPEAPALTSTHRDYTYAELHDDVMRLANEMADRGAGPESVVAVALDRSADSIVAIFAALSAGVAYVPIDVSLPESRIGSILRQSNPRLIISSAAHVELLEAAGAGRSQCLVLDDPATSAALGVQSTSRPDLAATSDLAAYLIFTSGSTGEPKGVIGTHGALASYFADHRDHVYAPATARLGRRLRIAHAWSLSFDASWQPMIGLLDGHCVHLFDGSQMRDAQQLVSGLIDHRIDMIDTSPSMFGQLAAAGIVGEPQAGTERTTGSDSSSGTQLSVLALGGEAISQALWQQLQDVEGVDVYNCYGPTEATVEALVAPINSSDVPTVGTPADRMTAHVLDSRLRPVPRGVVGELYLAGAQVTRGYVGQPGVTAGRYVADPYARGGRMYRTGDLVRRLPDGNLTFLGRADSQVKIRGFRIEIGEIETAMRQLPGVDTAAVVVVRRPTGATLVGFVVGVDLPAAQVRAALADKLPTHMLPARVLTVPVLPMTSNGKLDETVLIELAREALAGSSGPQAQPATDTERLLCTVFGELVDGPAPGVDEDFFDLGMDSIVAMSLVNLLRRSDIQVNPRLVLANPSVRTLAAAIDSGESVGADDEGEQGGPGEVVSLPVVRWMYDFGRFRRFTQTTLIALPKGLSGAELEATLQAILDSHAMLRSQLQDNENGYQLITRSVGSVRASDVLVTVSVGDDLGAGVQREAPIAMDRVDPVTGNMVAAVRLVQDSPDEGDVLLLAIHHLATDAVSWHVLFGDLAECGRQVASGITPTLGPEYTSYRRFSHLLAERSGTADVLGQRSYWAAQVAGQDPTIGARPVDPDNDTWTSLRTTDAHTSVEQTASVLANLGGPIGMREFLLAALTLTINTWRTVTGQDKSAGALIALEGHGREDETVGAGVDTSQTVGWFTSVFPVRLGAGADAVDLDAAAERPDAVRALVDSVAEHVGSIPNRGLDYGLLRHFERVPELVASADPQVEFNYLGRFDLSAAGASDTPEPWSPITDLELNSRLPTAPEPDLPLRYALDVVSVVRGTPEGPQLVTSWRWSEALMVEADADRLAEIWQHAVSAVAAAL